MKGMAESPDVHFGFYEFDETDLYIEDVGYNDFHSVTPIKTFRRQRFYTLHIVLSGSGILKLKDRKYTVPAHHIFFVPPELDMMYVPNDGDPWEYVWLAFNGRNSLRYMKKIGISTENPVIECNHFGHIYAQVSAFFRQRVLEDRYYEALSIFYQIVAANSIERKKSGGNFSEEVKTYLSLHYHNQSVSIEQLCRDMNISHAKLCRVFKSQAGTTPSQYLTDVRLREACKLLHETEMKIAEIAYSVGFCDPYHFMKVFKQTYGLTPSQFRKRD